MSNEHPRWIIAALVNPKGAKPAAFGLDMTVAIVAITERIFVCASDRMISFGDVSPASDDAAPKFSKISERWGVAFAGNDINLVYPILDAVKVRMATKPNWEPEEVEDAFCAEFAHQFHKQFVSKRLARYGFKSIEDFRENGRDNLGSEVFSNCA